MKTITPLKKTYFIADLHLSEQSADLCQTFLQFLSNQAQQAEKLYILGDLFEYWLGDDDDNPWLEQFEFAFKQLSQTTQIYFVQGNRDFLLGTQFCKRCNITLLADLTEIDLYGLKAVIMHGDTLCTKDISYQEFRKKSRSWWWQAIIKNLPLSWRRAKAESYRQQSNQAKQGKSEDIMDVTQTEVEQVMQKFDCRLMIHGHTHRPAVHQFTLNNCQATRIVLGDWQKIGSWLEVTPTSFQLFIEGKVIKPKLDNH